MVHLDAHAVVPPNLRHSKRRVNGELVQGFTGRVDLDDDIRRGIGFEKTIGTIKFSALFAQGLAVAPGPGRALTEDPLDWPEEGPAIHSRSFPSRGATDGSFRSRTHWARSLICIAQASAMLILLIFDDRAASLSRVPLHSGQLLNVTARYTNARMCGCIASTSLDRNDFWIRGTRPS